jgi:hypothetical protein
LHCGRLQRDPKMRRSNSAREAENVDANKQIVSPSNPATEIS